MPSPSGKNIEPASGGMLPARPAPPRVGPGGPAPGKAWRQGGTAGDPQALCAVLSDLSGVLLGGEIALCELSCRGDACLKGGGGAPAQLVELLASGTAGDGVWSTCVEGPSATASADARELSHNRVSAIFCTKSLAASSGAENSGSSVSASPASASIHPCCSASVTSPSSSRDKSAASASAISSASASASVSAGSAGGAAKAGACLSPAGAGCGGADRTGGTAGGFTEWSGLERGCALRGAAVDDWRGWKLCCLLGIGGDGEVPG